MLLFFWLQNIELAKRRVRIRVREGGHNIPEHVIERRYVSRIKNLFQIHLPIVDDVLICANSEGVSDLIAEKLYKTDIQIKNHLTFNSLKFYYDKN